MCVFLRRNHFVQIGFSFKFLLFATSIIRVERSARLLYMKYTHLHANCLRSNSLHGRPRSEAVLYHTHTAATCHQIPRPFLSGLITRVFTQWCKSSSRWIMQLSFSFSCFPSWLCDLHTRPRLHSSRWVDVPAIPHRTDGWIFIIYCSRNFRGRWGLPYVVLVNKLCVHPSLKNKMANPCYFKKNPNFPFHSSWKKIIIFLNFEEFPFCN